MQHVQVREKRKLEAVANSGGLQTAEKQRLPVSFRARSEHAVEEGIGREDAACSAAPERTDAGQTVLREVPVPLLVTSYGYLGSVDLRDRSLVPCRIMVQNTGAVVSYGVACMPDERYNP